MEPSTSAMSRRRTSLSGRRDKLGRTELSSSNSSSARKSAGDRAQLGGEADHHLFPQEPRARTRFLPERRRRGAVRRELHRATLRARCSRSPPTPRRRTRTRARRLASGFSSSAVHLASGLERLQAEKRAGGIPAKYDEARQASVSTFLPSHFCNARRVGLRTSLLVRRRLEGVLGHSWGTRVPTGVAPAERPSLRPSSRVRQQLIRSSRTRATVWPYDMQL